MGEQTFWYCEKCYGHGVTDAPTDTSVHDVLYDLNRQHAQYDEDCDDEHGLRFMRVSVSAKGTRVVVQEAPTDSGSQK